MFMFSLNLSKTFAAATDWLITEVTVLVLKYDIWRMSLISYRCLHFIFVLMIKQAVKQFFQVLFTFKSISEYFFNA